MAPPVERLERRYTLDEVRYSPQLRERMRARRHRHGHLRDRLVGAAPDQIGALAAIAEAIHARARAQPGRGVPDRGPHRRGRRRTIDNLSLSDRRAESVATILTEQFQVPAENLTTQGYGEQYLKVNTKAPERQNRRVTVRRITPLLQGRTSSNSKDREVISRPVFPLNASFRQACLSQPLREAVHDLWAESHRLKDVDDPDAGIALH